MKRIILFFGVGLAAACASAGGLNNHQTTSVTAETVYQVSGAKVVRQNGDSFRFSADFTVGDRRSSNYRGYSGWEYYDYGYDRPPHRRPPPHWRHGGKPSHYRGGPRWRHGGPPPPRRGYYREHRRW